MNDISSNAEVCKYQIQTILDRIDRIEEHSKNVQDIKLEQFNESIIKFNILIEKNDDTISKIMDEFNAYRKENQRIHEERDKIMRSMTESITKMNDSMNVLHHSMDRLDSKVSEMDNKMKFDIRTFLQKGLFNLLMAGFLTGVVYVFVSYWSKK